MPFVREGKRQKHTCSLPHPFTRDPLTGVSPGRKALWQCEQCGQRWRLFEYDSQTRWWNKKRLPPKWWNKLMADMRGMYRYD